MHFANRAKISFVTFNNFIGKRFYAFQYKRSSLTTEVLPPQFYILVVIPVAGYYLCLKEFMSWRKSVKLVATLKQRMTQPPVLLPEKLSDLKDIEYTPVKLVGEFDHENEFVIQPKQRVDDSYYESLKGYFDDFNVPLGGLVVTPFKLADRKDAKVLVSRGWVPKEKLAKESRESGQVKGQVEIVGITRNQEKKPAFAKESNPSKNFFAYRDVHSMAWTHKTLPYYFELLYKGDRSPDQPIGGQTSLFTSKAYYFKMFGWFSFATTTLVLWCLRLRHVRGFNFKSAKKPFSK